jgi:ATP-binding cassette subfamily F protein 3
MPLLAATNLQYSIGTRALLAGASFSIEAGERIGLVGRNGTGKSTLMKTIAGEITPDSGEVSLQRGCRLGFLTQDPVLDPDLTLRQEAGKAFIELARLHADLDAVFHKMESVTDDVELERLMKRQADLQHRIESSGGYAVDHRIDAVLHGLGFTDAQFRIPVAGLSGGQKGRLALAKLLIDSPDLLLLDEPTNHLDIAGREWLEDYLVSSFRGAVMMVSHDRYMLDRVVTRIEEIEDGRLIDYPGNYSAFCEIRSQRRLTQLRAFEKQQDRFKKEEEYIRRFKAGQRARQAQGRLSRLDREKRDARLERPMEMDSLRFQLPKPPRAGDLVLVLREASKRYDNAPDEDGGPAGPKVLFDRLDLTISRGERWAFIGPNGSGKTSLVKSILGQLPLTAGTIKIGSNVVTGYYSQTGDEADPTLLVYQYLQHIIRRENPGGAFSEQQARDLAGAFLFSGADQDKPIVALSGGERSRARLAGLLASAKNLLILDEPTNHLDIPAAERLEDALALPDEESGDTGGFEGTLILVSHDRAIIDATCDHLVVFDGHGHAEVFHGTYSEYHERQVTRAAAQKAADAEAQRRREQPAPAKKQPAPAPKKAEAKTGLSWMTVDRLEKEIASITKRLKDLDEHMSKEEVYRDAAKCRQLLADRDELQGDLERHEAEWLKRAED